jgi:hypothetical protein
MPFTAQELDNIMNASLDHFIRGKPVLQSIQDRPTLETFVRNQKKFGGGRGEIKKNVKGEYTTQFAGYTHDDSVGYSNPANMKQFTQRWFELHAGIQVTFTELKQNGITVVDSMAGEETAEASDREMFELSNILDDKLEDMREGAQRSFNNIFWMDGTQSAKVFGGIMSLITDNPTTGVVEGLDRSVHTWWRNRALTGGNRITANTSLQTLTKTLRSEVRQLRRFGGRPSVWVAGSRFIERLEDEVHEKGTYTQEGFTNKGKTDIGMAVISMKGVGDCLYDPTLDDLGRSNFAYFFDPRHLYLMAMDGEDMKQHNPARPPEKYVLYRGLTYTGCLVADKMNVHGVYEVTP